MKIAYLFPGQGSQYPGMGSDFFTSYPEAKETLVEAEDILQESIADVILYGPPKDLKKTRNSQLGLFIVSIALVRTVEKLFPQIRPTMTAGLSLGEFSALVAAHKMSFTDGLKLVERRGSFMEKACDEVPGTMSVVLGLSRDVVDQTIADLHRESDLSVANYNCPGQIVISGSEEAIGIAEELLKERGAKKVARLQVDGAFHSPLMRHAQENFSNYVEQAHINLSDIQLAMNVPGKMVDDVASIKQNLVSQVTGSVEWESIIHVFDQENCNLYLEFGAGKTLKGFNRRIKPEGVTISIEHVEDLNGLEKLLMEATPE